MESSPSSKNDEFRPKVLVYSIQSGFSHVNFMGRIADTLAAGGMDVTLLLNHQKTSIGSGTTKVRVIPIDVSKEAIDHLSDPPNMQVIELGFDERDPLYKCCCGIFHVKTGARITSVLNVIMSSSLIIQLFIIPYNLVFSILEYSGIAAVIVSSTSMFIATFTFRPKLVIAYLITQLTLSIFVSILFTTCIISIFLPSSVGRFTMDHVLQLSFMDNKLDGLSEQEANAEVIFVCFCFAVGLFLSFMWELLLLRVSFLCYNYLLDVRDAREGLKSHLPPLRLESTARGTILVGLEHKFDERDPLYKCCCGIFHVKTGTRILSTLNVVMSSSLLIIQLYFVPYNLVFSVIEVSLMIFASVLFIVYMVSIPTRNCRSIYNEPLIVLVAFWFAAGLFCSFLWEVFLLRVSFLCYNYLLDVRDAREGVNTLPPLRLESSARGVFLVGMEHVSTSCSNFQ
ncbi:hypothetical protein PRIPAC_78917 [Pristionchus pacificus]|uniref:Uncharacterized protein n=1 Tax=Pristionchus pacificus TaxID=54126 RepID=A0A2A6C3R4_PRIPA|nr:hypothetical protein PRIPAC_78917 [Pristionchus pacificus]|eukprot:PDM72661.1 hypothetical protein PRIPAC_39095 [Pristionchus pacificus]